MTLRQFGTIASHLPTFAVNGAANAIPLHDQTTAEISARYHVSSCRPGT